jgi:hypothetical protein
MTRRQLLIASSVLVILITVMVRISTAAPAFPPGVKQENWRSISSEVGIAIQRMKPGYDGPMVGTLMIRDGNRWRAIELVTWGVVPAR